MRKFLKHKLPDQQSVRRNRWLRPLSSTLLHPSLWHLNRHSAAGAVAVGLFCGLIPGPFQMLGAALGCVVFRVNLPLALLSTLYTNPFTFVPLYVFAFTIGDALIGNGASFTPPPEFVNVSLLQWLNQLTGWMLGLGEPLALGLLILSTSLAAIGYASVRGLWRLHSVRAWEARKRARNSTAKDQMNR